VLDPFLGSGTTLMVASRLGRSGIGVELNETYARLSEERIRQDAGSLFGEPVAVEMPRQLDIFGEATA
jgi:DNA modification methylase